MTHDEAVKAARAMTDEEMSLYLFPRVASLWDREREPWIDGCRIHWFFCGKEKSARLFPEDQEWGLISLEGCMWKLDPEKRYWGVSMTPELVGGPEYWVDIGCKRLNMGGDNYSTEYVFSIGGNELGRLMCDAAAVVYMLQENE